MLKDPRPNIQWGNGVDKTQLKAMLRKIKIKPLPVYTSNQFLNSSIHILHILKMGMK